MIVRPCAAMKSSLPDDTVEDEAGEYIIQFGGKAAAGIIAEMLGRRGFGVDAPADAGDHGWDFEVRAGCLRLLCQVTALDDYLVLLWNPSMRDKLFRRTPTEYVQALRALNEELNADPRFSEIRWFTQEEMNSPKRFAGSAVPVD